jgi:hypothetical protein
VSHTIKAEEASERLAELHVFTRTVGILAIITAVLYLRAIALGGYFSRHIDDPAAAAPVMFALLLLGAGGLVLAWRWECAGGAVALLGAAAIALYLNATLHSGRLLATLVYSSPFVVAGSLCLLDWYRQRRRA